MALWKRASRATPKAPAPAATAPQSFPWFQIDPWVGDTEATAAGTALASGNWAPFDALFRSRDVNLQASMLHSTLRATSPDSVLDDWIEAEPSNYVAFLARGTRGIDRAWEVRGGGRANTVGNDAWDVFWERLRGAEDDLHHATQLNDADPLAWGELLTSGRGLQISKDELWLRWEQVERREPLCSFAHDQMLQGLCAKWSGSHEEMFDFARTRMSALPEGHPLHRLIAVAHVERLLDSEPGDEFRKDRSHGDEVVAAATRSALMPSFGDTPDHRLTRNWFAFAMWAYKRADDGRPLIDGLESCITQYPWAMYGQNAAAKFRAVQEAAGVTPRIS